MNKNKALQFYSAVECYTQKASVSLQNCYYKASTYAKRTLYFFKLLSPIGRPISHTKCSFCNVIHTPIQAQRMRKQVTLDAETI